jgi:hypothetical protein
MPPSEHENERIERLRRAMYSRDLADKLHERPRHELDAEKGTVGEDWQESEERIAGVSIAPRVIDATRSALKWLLVAAIVFFIAAVGYFVYFFTLGGGSSPASPSNIDITVTGPPAAAGGEITELHVTIVNRNTVPLELADLVLNFPSGTRSPADFATDYPSTRIPLGTIEPGGKRQGTISAVFAGGERESETIEVELEYHVAGSNAVFVASRDYAMTFRSSPLIITVDGNTETVSGQPVQFEVNVVSNTNAPQSDVMLRIDFPFGFSFSSAVPAALAPNIWALGDFAPGQKKSVQILGVVRGEPGDARLFRLSAGTRASTAKPVIDTTLVQNSHPVRVSQSFLGLAIAVNEAARSSSDPFAIGTSSPDAKLVATVGPNETVSVTVSYVNNLTSPISDAVIVARLSGVLVDGSSVRSTDGFYRSSDGVVLWDKTTTQGRLGTIAPGARGTLTFSFVAPEGTVAGSSYIDISVNAAGKRLAETSVPQNLQSAVTKRVTIASHLQLAAYGLYNANPFDGDREGPIPPIAQLETRYAALFSITNTTSKITNAKLTAHLPTYVRWLGKWVPGTARVTANQSDGTITWNIGDIPAGTGVGGTEPLQAAILIGFTPSTSQIGQAPILVQDIKLTGIDSTTGKPVVCDERDGCTAKDITTNLTGDPGFDPKNSTVIKQPAF